MRLLLFFCVIWQYISAQTVKTSIDYKISNRVEKAQIIGKTSSGLVLRKTGSLEILELFSKELNFIVGKTINTRAYQVAKVDIVHDKIVYFMVHVQDTAAKIYVSIFSPNLQPIEEFRLLEEFKMSRGETAKNFKISASPGGLYTAILKINESGEKTDCVEVSLFDVAIEKTFRKKILLAKVPDKKHTVKKTMVDLEGNVFVVFDIKSIKEGPEDEHELLIHKLSKNNESISQSIVFERELFDVPKFSYDHKNKLINVTALFDEDNRGEPGSTGILLYRISGRDLSVMFKTHETYNKSFLSKLTGKDLASVQQKLLTFKIKEVALFENGGSIVFAESFFQTSETVRMQSSYFSNNNIVENRTISIYSFNDIIGFQFDNEGRIIREHILRKKQVTEDDGGVYSSFILTNNGNKLIFIHSEGIGNNVDFVAQSMQADGEIERKVLLPDLDRSAPLLVKMAKQISPNEVIIPSFRGNTFKLIKILF
jgi:hypothetical protein